jgi:predicted nucleotidyltransferase
MTRLTYEVRDGKARWDGRTLAEWVPDAVDRIVEGFAPERVVLFGSVASGTESPDSDVDLLVVFDHIDGRRHDVAVSIQRALEDIGAPVDIVVTDEDEIARRGDVPGLLRVALRRGTVVHDRAA